jgi:glucose/mannose-6-phosphate isomerase
MITKSDLEKIDTQGLFKIYDKWPKIAQESFELNIKPVNFENIKHIVFGGMGGSGAIGDVFSSILSKTNIHVNVVKGYLLPTTVNSDTLVIIVSVSGNTSEALAILDSAHKLNCKIIVFSSGGKMIKFCIENKIQHIRIIQHHSPRASFTAYLYTMLKVLYNILEIKEEDILKSINELKEINTKINSSNLTNTNPAINIAEWITNIPIIYYPLGLKSIAIRFKNSLQENCKIHAIAEDVVETCHNGIVAWEGKHNVKPIILRGSHDYIKTKERFDILKKYFKEKNIDFYEICSNNDSILSKIISLIYLLDYATIYFATLSKIDPSPVNSIDYIKKRM